GRQLRDGPRSRELSHEIGEPWNERAEARPLVDEAERIGVPRPPAALVVVRQELGLVRRDVDVDRAVALASLASETEGEGALHALVFPSVQDRTVAAQHLPEQVRAPTSRMLLLVGHHVTRAHHVVLALRALSAATPDAHAAQRCACEAATIVREAEVRLM